ncbi:MAG: hypothetical protein KAR42_13605 [candidate division Zixibacteria bacterium]|nr:hypothetical protein [candidate division Zixibacteria bacterium]
MKKSIIAVLAFLFLFLSFSASSQADEMSWADRQIFDRNQESTPIGDEDGWADLQSENNPNADNGDQQTHNSIVIFDYILIVNFFVIPTNITVIQLENECDLAK